MWAITPDKELLLLDRLRARLDNPGQQQQIHRLYQHYHPMHILVENVAYQLALIQQLRQQGLPVREFKPVKDKVSRASTASVFYEAGRVYHPSWATWLHEWEEELLLFPNGRWDDQVDALSMACESLATPLVPKQASEHLEALQARLQRQASAPAPVPDRPPVPQKPWWQL